jgi:glycosyltransferase involved in cell wall biosynthesis
VRGERATTGGWGLSPVNMSGQAGLRIHHVIANALAKHGGPSVVVTALCREQAALGHMVTLHSLAPLPEEPLEGFGARGYSWSPIARRIGVSFDMPGGLRAAAQSGDIMHVHGLWMLPNWWPAWAVRGTGCKLVSSPHGMLETWALERHRWAKRTLWHLAQQRALAASGLVHATSERELEAVRAQGLRAPIALIPNAVTPPAQHETAHFARTPRTLLVLSRLHPVKGIDRLLQAWASLQQDFPDWELRIVGPDSDGHGAALMQLAAALRAQRVTFAGPLFGQAKQQAYRDAQLYILPSHSENFGIGVAEALAFGLPAIVGRGAPWQGLEREGAGHWIDNHPERIAACLRGALARSPAELRAQGERGRAWMLREFSWGRSASQLLAAYTWLRDGGGVPPEIR